MSLLQHPDYDDIGVDFPNDIALLQLETEADLTDKYVATIPLPKESKAFVGNENCWLTGWGVFSKSMATCPSHFGGHTVRSL